MKKTRMSKSCEDDMGHTKKPKREEECKPENVLAEGLRSLGEIEVLNLPEIVRNTIMNYVDVNLSSFCTNTMTFTWKEEKCSYSSLVRKCQAFGKLISDAHIWDLIHGIITNGPTSFHSFVHEENVWKPWLEALVKSGCVTISKVATLAFRAGRLSITKWCLDHYPFCLQGISITGANRLLQLNTNEIRGGPESVLDHWKFIKDKGLVSNDQIMAFLTLDPPEALSERMVYDVLERYPDKKDSDNRAPISLSGWKARLERNAAIEIGWNMYDRKFSSLTEKLRTSESKDSKRNLHTQTVRHRSLSLFMLGFLTANHFIDREHFYQWFQWMRSIGIDTKGLLFEPWQLISLLSQNLNDNHCLELIAWLEPYIKDTDVAVLRDVDEILVGHGFGYEHQKTLPVWRRLCLRYHPTISFEYVNLCRFDIDWKSDEWAILRDKYMRAAEESSKRFRPPVDLTDCWPHSLVELFALAVKSRLIPTSDIQPREWVRIALEDGRNSPMKYLQLHVEPTIAPNSFIDMITGHRQLPMQVIDNIVTFFTRRFDHTLNFFTQLTDRGDTRWRESKSWHVPVETLALAIEASEQLYQFKHTPYFVSYANLLIKERIWNADEAMYLVTQLIQLLTGRKKSVEIVVKMAMVVHWAYPLLTANCPAWVISKKESGWDSEMWQHNVHMSGLRLI